MTFGRSHLLTATVFALSVAVVSSPGHAQGKSGNGGGPGGSNGGGGGGGDATAFQLVDLGGFAGGSHVQAWAQGVNNPDNAGVMQVVGYSLVSNGDEHAALWDVTVDGQILDLSDIAPPSYVDSRAQQVNDVGHVLVGNFVYIPGRGLVTMPGFGNGNGSPALLNDLGDVIGSATDGQGIERVAQWHIDSNGQVTGPIDLGAGSDTGGFSPADLNDNGVMAGHVGLDAAIAWFDDQGQFQIMTLGALDPLGMTEAVAINDHEMVAGTSTDRFGFKEAFVWTLETGMVGLGVLGGQDSVATDINNQGQVVGWSDSNSKFPQVGFLWDGSKMVDLNTITQGADAKNWIQIASGLNDRGDIVGLLTKTKPVSEQHGLLLLAPAN